MQAVIPQKIHTDPQNFGRGVRACDRSCFRLPFHRANALETHAFQYVSGARDRALGCVPRRPVARVIGLERVGPKASAEPIDVPRP